MSMDRFKTPAHSAQTQGQDAPLIERLDGPVLTATLNAPQTRNALSEAMIGALHDLIGRAGADSQTRAVIITAQGPAFCAGHDLKELTKSRADADGGRAYFTKIMHGCSALMKAIVTCPKPVIAAVETTATAAGCQLVASCDLAVAGEGARFCTPGVNIGLFCSTPMVALSRNLSRKRAMEMLLLGEMISATEAARYGLVNRVVPAGSALGEAGAMAAKIAAKSPVTVAIGKEAFYRQIEQPLGQAYDYAADVMVRNMLEADAIEGIGAFLDKRPPRWSGQ